MNPAAPTSSPTAKLPLFEFIAAKVEKTSGLPFPNAKNVTPAMLSLMPKIDAIVERFIPETLLDSCRMDSPEIRTEKVACSNTNRCK
jgi:hypothetical protein